MEMMAIGLIVFAIVLFILCLYLAVWATPATPGKNVFNAGGAGPDMEEQKFIVVKLPQPCLPPENYTLNIKVTLHRGKDETGDGKPDLRGRWYKHQLDEYL